MAGFLELSNVFLKRRMCAPTYMKVSGSRSPARSKQNARVRSATRKTNSGGGGTRSTKSVSSQGDNVQSPDIDLNNFPVSELLDECSQLLFFNDILEDELIASLLSLLDALENSDKEDEESRALVMSAYRDYFCTLASDMQTWENRLISLILSSDNRFSSLSQTKKVGQLPRAVVNAAAHDLTILQRLLMFDPEKIASIVFHRLGIVLPAWAMSEDEERGYWEGLDEEEKAMRQCLSEPVQWNTRLDVLGNYYYKKGAGIYNNRVFFVWDSAAADIVPVESTDRIIVEDIYGNRRPKKIMGQNLEFLLSGLSAQHMLLTGVRGSGKSSMVKAFVNSFAHRGLRMIELNGVLELEDFHSIFAEIENRSQKFVLFIDDFNYDFDDEEFRCLRKVLDGSSIRVPKNAVFVVTSGRFVELQKSSAAETPGPEDVLMEEDVFGFCDRFGSILTLDDPTKEHYLETVKYLAERAGVGDIGSDILELRASYFAKVRGGWCGRTAHHFISFLTSEQTFLKSEMNDCRSNIGRINEASANSTSKPGEGGRGNASAQEETGKPEGSM
eukprot:Plantae.Rhodophyta-Purpureofilum_apyrenoidigerum.ctg4846.p1 GENE.Plantae.Rhodophyta-Purpureofilum_apyrenoidigerum.ctg4846~~Plantae.Rhodophyta-Purpureofilum_apyrenoidigerum.ctg4846.p1  ORF type:complete len:557 (-),score=108.29 Plantae.Rhodophyta-Purpureofilum_apyrenoidigerum.ctg4846:218-1888(-)